MYQTKETMPLWDKSLLSDQLFVQDHGVPKPGKQKSHPGGSQPLCAENTQIPFSFFTHTTIQKEHYVDEVRVEPVPLNPP